MNLSTEIETTKTDILAAATGLQVIETAADLADATAILQDLKAMQKRIGDFFDPHVKRAHEAHKALTQDRAKFLEPLEQAEGQIKTLCGNYELFQKKAREAAQRQLEESARKDEQERRAAQAEELKAQGHTAEASAVLAEPVHVAVVAPPVSVKPSGLTSRTVWKYEVVSADLLPREYMIPDEKAISGVVRSMKGKTSIPGVRVWEDVQTSVKG